MIWLIPISIMLFIEPSKMELVTGRIWWFDQIMGQKKLEKAFIRSSFERWRLANQIQPIRLRLKIFKNLFQTKQGRKWTFRQNKSPLSVEMTVQFDPFWILGQVVYVDRPLWRQYGSLPFTSQGFFLILKRYERWSDFGTMYVRQCYNNKDSFILESWTLSKLRFDYSSLSR